MFCPELHKLDTKECAVGLGERQDGAACAKPTDELWITARRSPTGHRKERQQCGPSPDEDACSVVDMARLV